MFKNDYTMDTPCSIYTKMCYTMHTSWIHHAMPLWIPTVDTPLLQDPAPGQRPSVAALKPSNGGEGTGMMVG